MNNLQKAAISLIGCELLLACMGIAIKHVAVDLPNEMIVFFRNFFGLIALAPWLHQLGWSKLKTKVLHLHLLRGLSGVAAMYCFFYTIANITLAEATVLKLTSPFFIPIVAFLWLAEPIPNKLKYAVLLGFAGVLLIMRPGFNELTSAMLVGLAGALFAGFAKVAIRRLASEPSAVIVCYFGLIASTVSIVPLTWAWVTPSLENWLTLLFMGICATCAQLLMTRAYRLAPASKVGPFTYFSVIFAAAFGWIFWNETIALISIAGTLLIIGAGFLTMQTDKKVKA